MINISTLIVMGLLLLWVPISKVVPALNENLWLYIYTNIIIIGSEFTPFKPRIFWIVPLWVIMLLGVILKGIEKLGFELNLDLIAIIFILSVFAIMIFGFTKLALANEAWKKLSLKIQEEKILTKKPKDLSYADILSWYPSLFKTFKDPKAFGFVAFLVKIFMEKQVGNQNVLSEVENVKLEALISECESIHSGRIRISHFSKEKEALMFQQKLKLINKN